MNDITEKLRNRVAAMPEVSPPPPWRKVCQRNVSTLVGVGYDKGSDLKKAILLYMRKTTVNKYGNRLCTTCFFGCAGIKSPGNYV